MMPMAETRSSSGGGRPAVYGARRKAISVYMPPAWDPQLRQLSKETQLNLSQLALQAMAEKYGLSLEPPGRDEQPALPVTETDRGRSSVSAA
jgi:hypothetical protein